MMPNTMFSDGCSTGRNGITNLLTGWHNRLIPANRVPVTVPSSANLGFGQA